MSSKSTVTALVKSEVIQVGKGGVDGVVDEGVGAEHRQPSGDVVVDLLRGGGGHRIGAGGLVLGRVPGDGHASSEVVRKDWTVMLSRAGSVRVKPPGGTEEQCCVAGEAAGHIHAVVHQREETSRGYSDNTAGCRRSAPGATSMP